MEINKTACIQKSTGNLLVPTLISIYKQKLHYSITQVFRSRFGIFVP